MNKFLKLAIFFACLAIICQNVLIFMILKDSNIKHEEIVIIFFLIFVTVLLALYIYYIFNKSKVEGLWQTINSQSIENHNLTQLVIKLAKKEIEEE